MNTFIAKIKYEQGTVELLSKVVSKTFSWPKRLLARAIGAAAILASLFLGLDHAPGLLLLFFGSLVFTGVNTPARLRAKQSLQQLGGRPLELSYVFLEDSFTTNTGKEKTTVRYSELIRLVPDEKYLYLFTNRKNAYMICRETVNPQNAEALMEFLREKSSLEWKRPFSFLRLNLYTLLGKKKHS